uniref:Uncharacterized protein n=1 Tax=Molossus molossus TaxID=27622 RepID=A0A7J8B980_MOLMO|nr:hypothetical protein HJG59_010481 [Molossus molossus]
MQSARGDKRALPEFSLLAVHPESSPRSKLEQPFPRAGNRVKTRTCGGGTHWDIVQRLETNYLCALRHCCLSEMWQGGKITRSVTGCQGHEEAHPLPSGSENRPRLQNCPPSPTATPLLPAGRRDPPQGGTVTCTATPLETEPFPPLAPRP